MKAEEKAIVTVTDPQLTKGPEGAVAGTGVPPGEPCRDRQTTLTEGRP